MRCIKNVGKLPLFKTWFLASNIGEKPLNNYIKHFCLRGGNDTAELKSAMSVTPPSFLLVLLLNQFRAKADSMRSDFWSESKVKSSIIYSGINAMEHVLYSTMNINKLTYCRESENTRDMPA